MKSRIFNVMQYERHPETGEILLTEEKIKDCVAHRTIKRWAYILHDEDVYTALDEEQDLSHEKGKKKPPHWHVCIEMGTNQVEVGVIAKWLGIKDNYVNVARGAGAFLDCVKYLTHEDEKQYGFLGKRLYEDTRVKANFDFRSALDKRAANKMKYGRDLDERDAQRVDVLQHGKTLKECQDQDPVLYANDMDRLRKLRNEYLANQPAPVIRINYYIEGKGGIGKGTLSRMLAKALFPGLDDRDCYFETGSSGALLDGYDGQPVIIWHDKRAAALLKELGGRGNVFNVFDSHPSAARQNIKYSTVSLVNSVNIVNGVESYQDFLDGLAGEYTNSSGDSFKAEDKGQSYRRFPLIICLRESDFDILINRGFAEGTFEFTQYMTYRRVVGNFGKVVQRLEGVAREKAIIDLTNPIVEKHHELEEKQTQEKITKIEDMPDEFLHYGESVQMEIEEE